ncbi:class I alpha-mannosidase [Hortaea werneckii]|nr:class I alpha-mannosidase [Hortaea werneckii]KAI7007908.1 class I alpha-mannosidase [Hortaea werneckii]KAI7205333.1 class I alpha-mannosidase [Hortaea werneckii]KAI7595795.1 class I alpha-mannosidase [Hortaea werneckii]KAI7659136.1 class I alpha-mannosidase [Hortaea werneckii]
MLPILRRWTFYTVLAAAILFLLLQLGAFLDLHPTPRHHPPQHLKDQDLRLHQLRNPGFLGRKFKWKNLRQQYPVSNFTSLPSGPLANIPKIQHEFVARNHEEETERQGRQAAVKDAFLHSWQGYKEYAWAQDEVAPISGVPQGNFGGWGATLVDSLDTLWIMGLEEDFKLAVSELKKIDFTTSVLEELNVFETTIRYAGGFLSAFDLSGHAYPVLLEKAVELGEMLYHALDTPNRMPITRWRWKNTMLGEPQKPSRSSIVAEVGSLTMEFTRLSQLTGDPKWYDAVVRIMNVFEQQQNQTKIPGLWPMQVDTREADFTKESTFSIGGMVDSLYEYLPKEFLMLGGRRQQYRDMYTQSLQAMKENIFFRPLNADNKALLIPGTKRKTPTRFRFTPEAQHLSCYAGGMVALAATAFDTPDELDTARQLVEGCIWAYESTPTGIMPEVFQAAPCQEDEGDDCTWSQEKWYHAIASPNPPKGASADVPQQVITNAMSIIETSKLPPGFTRISDSRYMLRPEAIESVFILYRITGDRYYQDKAWNMFQSITSAARTEISYAGIQDVRELNSTMIDSMESFWTAETLKYFYLIFSEPDLVSLDDYVLNTEAHPLLRPTR